MKRALLLLPAAFLALPAFSFDANRRDVHRVTLLRTSIYNGGESETEIAARVRRQLVRALRERGVDAVDGNLTYDEWRRSGQSDSDLYVELVPVDTHQRPVAGVGLPLAHGDVEIAVIVSRVAAELRVYDGASLDVIARRRLRRENTDVVPAAVGVGTYRMSAVFVLPIAEYVRTRRAVNAVAGEAANVIMQLRR